MSSVKDYSIIVDAPDDVYADALRLRGAMIDQKTVSFIYEGKAKVVEIHAIGVSTKDGGLIARGYQVAGHSSRQLPVWALYRVDKMEGVIIDPLQSQAPRYGYKTDDAQMSPVLSEVIP